MAFLDQEFDVESLPVSETNYEPLPAGWYDVTIAGAEIRNTKSGNGQYIAVRYDVLGPTHQGRVVFANLNIKNESSKAEEIGRQQLGELMRAIGLTRINDTDQLIGGNLQIKLAIRTQEGYDPSNDVRGFKSLNGGGVPAPQPAPATEKKTGSAAPWAKK